MHQLYSFASLNYCGLHNKSHVIYIFRILFFSLVLLLSRQEEIDFAAEEFWHRIESTTLSTSIIATSTTTTTTTTTSITLTTKSTTSTATVTIFPKEKRGAAVIPPLLTSFLAAQVWSSCSYLSIKSLVTTSTQTVPTPLSILEPDSSIYLSLQYSMDSSHQQSPNLGHHNFRYLWDQHRHINHNIHDLLYLNT